MAQLIVRNIEEKFVRLLKIRAAQHGRSAEAEHREILRTALQSQGAIASFDSFLFEMPEVGEDRDFERLKDTGRRVEM